MPSGNRVYNNKDTYRKQYKQVFRMQQGMKRTVSTRVAWMCEGNRTGQAEQGSR